MCMCVSKPRSKSSPILKWTSPDPNSDLGWANLEPSWPKSKYLTEPAKSNPWLGIRSRMVQF